MKLIFVVFLCLLSPGLGWSQSESEMMEAAKLAMIEKMYETSADTIRKQLQTLGVSEERSNEMVAVAFEKFADCVIRAANEQAKEQGLSQEIILKSFGAGTSGKDEARIAMEIDDEALHEKQKVCDEQFNKDLKADTR
jgi:hypothetical protein